MQHICVCPSSETWRKRDHSEGEKEEGEHYGVSPFSGDDVDCVQVLSVSRRCERASEAENERDFFVCVRGTTEGS
jgi:hypothetical protein